MLHSQEVHAILLPWPHARLPCTKPPAHSTGSQTKFISTSSLTRCAGIYAQPAEATLAVSREQVARSLGLPLRRQFFVVAEDRARSAGLSSLAGSVTRHLAAPRDLRGTLISWVNFIFLPEAVNRCA